MTSGNKQMADDINSIKSSLRQLIQVKRDMDKVSQASRIKS